MAVYNGIINIASLDGDELCSAQPSLPLSYLSPLSLPLERSGITCFSHGVSLLLIIVGVVARA